MPRHEPTAPEATPTVPRCPECDAPTGRANDDFSPGIVACRSHGLFAADGRPMARGVLDDGTEYWGSPREGA
jgi:hypothetical protein